MDTPMDTPMARVADGVRSAQQALVHDGWAPEYLIGEFVRGDRRCAFNWTMGSIQVSVWTEADRASRWLLDLTARTDPAEIDMLATVLGGAYPPAGWTQR